MSKIFKNILKKLGYIFPMVFLLIIFNNSIIDYLFMFISDVLIAFGIIFLSKVLLNKIVNKIIEICGLILFNIMVFIELGHFYLFHDKIRASSLFIIFNTNREESLDFFSMYLDKTLILVLITMLIGMIISILAISISSIKLNNRKENMPSNKKHFSYKYILLSLLIFLPFFLSYKIRASSLPHIVYTAFNKYKLDRITYNQLADDPFGGNFTNLEHSESAEQEIYILIIGESTSRKHMQLYDYYRDTNPNLNSIKRELLLYSDVISPNAHTIQSLDKCLTFANHNNKDGTKEGNIIQMFNKAGYNTFWISNQIPLGIFETETTIISKSCNEQIFTNVSVGFNKKSYDEKVLYPLKKILEKDIKKKFIVIHLYGTHSRYSKRYPVNFDFFKDEPQTLFLSEKSKEMINSYDNAVRYNDFIVSEIINLTRTKNSKSFVLYFSDHGEEMYDNEDFAGHTDANFTKLMLEIPFLLWRSDKYENSNLVYNTKRKYSTEDLIYSLSDLANIKFKEFDSTRSIFNKHFIERKRTVPNGKIYEDIYGK